MRSFKANTRSLIIYGALTLATLGWWFAAFHTSHQPLTMEQVQLNTELAPCPGLDCLSSLNRDELHRALLGDFSLMQDLISTWDIDAQLLQACNIPSIERLPQNLFLRSQEHGRQIAKGNSKKAPAPHLKFLPQTYVAASFLMALVPNHQIVAIPKGLRKLTQIYSSALMEQIPYDIDRYHTEILFHKHPDIAFVAHYSDPATLQTLQDQGIRLVFLKNMDSLAGIQEGLMTIGTAAQVPIKAELMSVFIEAALLNMDNRIRAIQAPTTPKILYLDYYERFALPTEKTLQGKLLKRLGINSSLNASSDAWSILFTSEELASENPAALIVAAAGGSALKQKILQEAALTQIDAVKHGRIYVVDEAIQDSPSQYLVLAYYDLFHILERVLRP